MEMVAWIVLMIAQSIISDPSIVTDLSLKEPVVAVEVDCEVCQEKCQQLWREENPQQYCKQSCSFCPLCALVDDPDLCQYCKDGITGCDKICFHGIEVCDQCKEQC
ncbi:hypothetical protein TCAL_16070 [Tigriopus californicus]|uniref:TNFR-Cys domain-containing protein n=1 Tax=Tigriopus californicus TaxID=6832 RepID=A0A553PQH4_TIGCA|nr:hypothetical protein TCAL_16070 [Tigriopus californicus]